MVVDRFPEDRYLHIVAIGLKPPVEVVVSQLEHQYLDNLLRMVFFSDRCHKLYTSDQVTGHQVGTGNIASGLGMFEVVDTRMFKVLSDDGVDRDVFTDSLDTRFQAADPSDDQVDPTPLLGGFVECLDDILVHQ